MKTRIAACALLALLICALGSSALGQDQWPMLRHDNARTGLAVGGALSTFRPAPTWVFPAPETSTYTVDNGDAAFSKTGTWNDTPLNGVAPYLVEGAVPYLWTPTGASATATAEWTFTFNGGAYTMRGTSAKFMVFVWVPSPGAGETPQHCEDAHYTVELTNGATGVTTTIGHYTLDQTSGGGWQNLPNSPSLLVQKTDTVVVKLSNVTERKDDTGNLVVSQVLADAVMLKTDTGMVFASPAASTTLPLVISASTEFASVARGGNFGNANIGAVYGIGAEVNSGIVASAVDDRGMMKWRYPAGNNDWIAGGISSSPTLTTALGSEKVVAAGVDGQVYVLDADTGAHVWNGPGYFDENMTLSGSWNPYTGAGVRGADSQTAQSVKVPAAATATATWTFSPITPGTYDAYAWIPPSGSEMFVQDARYTDLKSTDPTAKAKVYQGGGGFWALVCKGFKSTGNTTIKLTNETEGDASNLVVADEMKLVPADVQSFDFSSPVVDGSGYIYIGSAGSAGRVLKLKSGQSDPVWTYPSTSDAPIGSIHASPAIGPDGTIYVGSADGHIYAINPDGTPKWVYPNPSGTPAALPEISSTTAVTDLSGKTYVYFSTGAASSGGSSGDEGKVYAIQDNGQDAVALQWTYPSSGQLGAFVYSSPLIMELASGNGKPQVVAGSTNGTLYTVDGASGIDNQVPQRMSVALNGLINSSPAGTYVTFPTYADRNVVTLPLPVRTTAAPMAFVGSGSRIYGVDLTLPLAAPATWVPKDWWWDLLGNVISSPAVTKNRIYAGDTAGYTWAFSTGLAGGGGQEGWNTELGPMPETSGSDHTAGGRDAKPEVDVFVKSDWDVFRRDYLEPAEHSDGNGTSKDWFRSSEIRKHARDHGATRPGTYQMEWGEDMVIVVWNLIDPNRSNPNAPNTWKRRFDSSDGTSHPAPGWTHDYRGRVEISIKGHAPGAASASEEKITLSDRQIDNFTDMDDDPDSVIDAPGTTGGKNGYSCFYAVCEYTLDGSSSGKAQTPGSMFNITAREIPNSPNASSLDIPVPHALTGATPDLNPAQEFAINNPIGVLTYNAPYTSVAQSSPVDSIGMDPANRLTTKRDLADAMVNGNLVAPPVIWGGYTPHNRLSETRTIAIADRSLLSVSGRRISKFRAERHDMRWTGAIPQVINELPWERNPSNTAANMPNSSEDYPDIDLRQIKVRLLSNGTDPSQSAVDLRKGITTAFPAAGAPWNMVDPVGLSALNPVSFAVQVPQFQPPNLPWSGNPSGTRADTGYTSYVYAYIDSNNNGMMDRPAGLGIGQLISSAVTGTRAEAFRMLEVQVHVPADYRAQIENQRVNIGEVPQGFGYTAKSGVPWVFAPNLVPDPMYGVLAPAGFGEWFKPLTIRNTGNVNLVNVGMLRTDMVSDTVQQPVIDGTGAVIPGSGFYIPAQSPSANPCLVSTVDDSGYLNGAGFMTSVPPAMLSALRPPSRTFHKARVGESAPELRLPDYTSWAPAIPQVPQVPAISVAVPLGTPTGTYYGKVQLSEKGNAVSNPVDVVVTCNESRITGGNTLPVPNLTHLDNPSTPGMTGVSGTPAAFRNPATGNVLFFWSSSRYPDVTINSTAQPTSSDPAYLYFSKLEAQTNGEFGLSTAAPAQWWAPTTTTSVFPKPSRINDFFPSATTADPTWGAVGNIIPGSVKFGSPTVAVDKVNKKSYLLFTGQAGKTDPRYKTEANYTTGARNTQEFRAYYTEINGETVDEGNVYSTSPNNTTEQIHGDWATPKFGVRGGIMIRAAGDTPELWNFWYGGSSGKWRIYYNVKANPSTPPSPTNQWTNEALLPIPKGLSSVSEPSPVFHYFIDKTTGEFTETGNEFMVTYSGMSVFHKNSDIYMSRYISQMPTTGIRQGNSKPVDLALMPQRANLIPEVNDPATSGTPLLGEKLTRDPATSVWYSKDVDWLADDVSGVVTVANPRDFAVFVRLDPTDPASVYQLNVGQTDRDASTGAIVYNYGGGTAVENTLRTLFRAVVINPADGTVKFMKAPNGKALVVARYFPKAYRLTTDGVADSNPCAVMDDDVNPRYSSTNTTNLPFFMPNGSPEPVPTDRLWVFWRRPAMDKTGTGIYYKAQRYMVQLNSQMGLDVKASGAFTPSVASVMGVDPVSGTSATLKFPVEIDWVKNRLYFASADGRDKILHGTDANGNNVYISYPKHVKVTYTDSKQNVVTDEDHYVQYADEDISQAGKTFGNLTSLMVNEGQVNAFKDPFSNRLWVFWTSTRSGNSDVYYETISPRIIGKEYR